MTGLPLPGPPGLPAADRCLVMGVVNVTPDSFSDGGQWYGATAAIKHGLDLVAHGADIVRVHDVRENVRVARMSDAIVRGTWHEARVGDRS